MVLLIQLFIIHVKFFKYINNYTLFDTLRLSNANIDVMLPGTNKKIYIIKMCSSKETGLENDFSQTSHLWRLISQVCFV